MLRSEKFLKFLPPGVDPYGRMKINRRNSMTRTDIHRVSQIIPADYKYLFSFSFPGLHGDPGFNNALLTAVRTGRPAREPVYGSQNGLPIITGWAEIKSPWGRLDFFNKDEHGSDAGGCDVCGSHHRHGDVWQHVPTGECIVIGHQCADKYDLLVDRASWRRAKRTNQKMRARAMEAIQCREDLRTWVRENREAVRLLKTDHSITRNMRERVIRKPEWGLSEKQIGLLKKLAKDAQKPSEKHVAVPVDGERIQVEGTVVSVKDGRFGGLKMTVKVETQEGSWLCWGTAPDSLLSADAPLKGQRVQFTAKVLRGDRDEFFGFFKRPAKARRLVS